MRSKRDLLWLLVEGLGGMSLISGIPAPIPVPVDTRRDAASAASASSRRPEVPASEFELVG